MNPSYGSCGEVFARLPNCASVIMGSAPPP
jgi:hypothetical protein